MNQILKPTQQRRQYLVAISDLETQSRIPEEYWDHLLAAINPEWKPGIDRSVPSLIKRGFDSLKIREEEVLRLRFGLMDGKKHTLQEIADGFKVTRERIRQVEAKALRKLEIFCEQGNFIKPSDFKNWRSFWRFLNEIPSET